MDYGRMADPCGSILLGGGSSERISACIREVYPGVATEVVPAEELLGAEHRTITAICPSDTSELRSFADSLPPGGAMPQKPVLFCPVGIEVPPVRGRVVLREGPFAVDVLVNMTVPGFPVVGPAPLYDFLTLARTGTLLPFFFHNINNILTRIMGNIELAGYYLDNGEKLGKRLGSAMEGTEELRSFLGDLSLATQNAEGDGSSGWTAGGIDEVYRIGRMSSGSSVEFTHETDPEMPERLPVRRDRMNTLLGAMTSAATLFVNGSGSIHLASSVCGSEAVFTTSWRSTSGEGSRSRHQVSSAIALIARAASLSPRGGISFDLEEWRSEGGRVSILVEMPRSAEDGGSA